MDKEALKRALPGNNQPADFSGRRSAAHRSASPADGRAGAALIAGEISKNRKNILSSE
jgi:hypothetical protein